MSRSQRIKGAAAEREFAALLNEHLGVTVSRELGQSRDGGCDLRLTIAGKPAAIEVKRHERASPLQWVRQVKQVEADYHVVAWRPSRTGWMAIMPMETLVKLMREAGVE